MKKTNCVKLTKHGIEKINSLLKSHYVNDWHKYFLRTALQHSKYKNLQRAEATLINKIGKQYEGMII